MVQTLIVARMNPANADAVAAVFAESDASGLPQLIGVRRRTLFAFHDLYLHLMESEDQVPGRLREVGNDQRWRDVNEGLRGHIAPYDPQTWRSPSDAMAQEFYTWRAA